MHPIIRDKIRDIASIAARRRVKKLAVFGSAAGDRFKPAESDIDFLVEFEPMTPVEHAEAYFGLEKDLAELFDREIDLVELSAIRNPFFRESVEETRKDVYAVA
ncbi:MAG: nucleotidyltransferase domain-containing protein [Methanomicrobiaceae archaeon]|uniref:Dna polymerase, beta-like region n=1 Tax=hydrocarbon metagenome TaxID=938273 RepID=A0A0W8FGP1_9ZZZZ|nr:nucleotidyltransferase domain-containing protein [Methanomicrobiaceae archaeon]MDD5418490.1 nucleotidyltransferase domain-containing protein [Methanomicrobiaceae archaeon]